MQQQGKTVMAVVRDEALLGLISVADTVKPDSAAAVQALQRMGLTVVEDILRALRGERPQYLANPEVWARRRVQA